MMNPQLSTPDFLILGIDDPQSGGVWLIASDSLFEASISIDVQYDDYFSIWDYAEMSHQIGQTISIDTKMTGYIWIWGETYAAAMQNLQRQWTPKKPARPELESRLELES